MWFLDPWAGDALRLPADNKHTSVSDGAYLSPGARRSHTHTIPTEDGLTINK